MNIKRKLPLILSGALLTVVFASTSTFASTGTVTAQTVRVRQYASTESEILTRIFKDNKVEVTGEEGDWYKVTVGDITGYVSKAYLSVTEDATPAETNEQPVTVEEPETPATSTILGDTTNQETKAYVVPTFGGAESFSIDSNKKVEVIATLANWSKVKLGSQEGWIPNTVLMATSKENTPETPTEQQPEETTPPQESTMNQKGYVSSNASANFRAEPTTNSTALGKLPRYTEVQVVGEVSNGWYKVTYNGQTGYISKSLITLGSAPEQPSSRKSDTTRSTTTQAQTNAATNSQVVTGAAPASSHAGGVVGTAQSLLGKSYKYGGSNPSTGFDCSGFTSYVYAQNGVTLNRTASGQLNNGVPVSKENLQPGDLVMFGGSASSVYHVGIYVGNGQMIHAANSNRGVVYDTINSGYYANNYYGARRVQ